MAQRNLNYSMSPQMESFLADESVKRERRKKFGIATLKETELDWTGECGNCGASPIVPATGMCGPCTFGEAETANGNW